ncbi:MAG: hypothetical protein CM1200mP3_00700 [Chloroflexota bacterium]|nr:MAG: hypothetical protein CM1200mP3_00700 [Chloroflexota bacterium]
MVNQYIVYWGGAQSRIRTYIAGGYYAEGKGLAELQEEVRFNVEEMHAGAVKIKIGDPNPKGALEI